MLRLNRVLGEAGDPRTAEKLHRLEHQGKVEYIILNSRDTSRKRLRLSTDQGTDCAIALPRTERLGNGSVLLLDEARAIVVRLRETPWLGLVPADACAALELGYFAGNAHWRVRFDGARLEVALDGPAQDYLDRLDPLLKSGRVRRVKHDD